MSKEYIAKPGDMVKCHYNFDEERTMYKLNYPRKDEYLTISSITRIYPSGDCAYFFEEKKLSIPLVAGRFELVQTESEADNILNETFKIANKL